MAFTRIAEVSGGPDSISTTIHFTGVSLFGISIAGIVGYFPIIVTCIAGALAAIMYSITIWESKTVQHWIANRRMIWKARKVARLKAKQKVLVAQLEAVEKVRVARHEARDIVEAAKNEAAVEATVEEAEAATKLPPL